MDKYIHKTWENGEIIDEDKLNNIETGILEAKKAAEKAAGLPMPTTGDAGKAVVVKEDGSFGLDKVDVAVDQEVLPDSPNPVSGAAVAAYAFPKDMIVATTVDPGEGAAVEYPDGTVILVYE